MSSLKNSREQIARIIRENSKSSNAEQVRKAVTKNQQNTKGSSKVTR